MSRLAGKLVLITGATRGLGRATALELARAGARLAVAARTVEQLDEVVAAVKDLGGDATSFVLDLGAESAIDELDERVASELGAVDVLVNNAGLAMPQLIKALTPDVVRPPIDVNVVGTMLLTGRIVRRMVERGSGHVVNIGSKSGQVPLAYMGVYGATKAALDSFTTSLRAEVGPQGIRVTHVEVNHTETSFGDAWPPELLAEMAASWEAAGHVRNAPLIAPPDVAEAVRFVLERRSAVEIDRISVGPAFPPPGKDTHDD